MDIGSLVDVLTRLILGLGIGFINGMTGIGSGVLVMPALIYVAGLPAISAVGTGLLYAMLARLYAVYVHLKLRTVRKRTAFYIILGGVPTVLVTSFIMTNLAKTPVLFCVGPKCRIDLNAGRIPEDMRREFQNNSVPISQNATVLTEEKDGGWTITDEKTYDVREKDGKMEVYPANRLDFFLRIIISCVMLMTWVLMLMSLLKSRKDGSEDYYVPLKTFSLRRKLYGIAAGAVVGVLIGSTSIGGGVLIIPILVSVFRLSPNNTVGTSILVGIAMSAMGSLAYLMGGGVDIVVAVTMFIGAIPGGYLGSRAAVKLPHKALSIILFAIITIGVVLMFAGLK